MKKIYNKPTTNSIQLLGQNSIMVGSTGFIDLSYGGEHTGFGGG